MKTTCLHEGCNWPLKYIEGQWYHLVPSGTPPVEHDPEPLVYYGEVES